ncbi:MAG TPA: hypothetical protein ENI23_13020 [bacterium]|nr:hypothetical protein [bacterium]
MKIQKLVLQNVKSFRDEVSIEFKNGLNVFIGPNTGGKSNLMDILNISLGYYFIYPWRLVERALPSGLIRYNIQNRRDLFNPVQQFLDKNSEIENQDQKITICFEVTDEDVKNLEIIKNYKDKLVEFEKKEYGSIHLNDFIISNDAFQQHNKVNIQYQINNYSEPKSDDQDVFSKLFLQYLNYFELVCLLIEKYNREISSDEEKIEKLFPLTLYFSPYRNPTIQNLRVSIASQDQFNLIENYKKNTSKDTSSILEYANFYFALKLRNYDDNSEIFRLDEEVKFIQKYIKKLGYTNFELVPIDKQKNIYEITLKKGQKDIEITKASSGEKEIINLLFGIFAFNVKRGIVIIDEPDLHLHPRWQRLLLELFNDLSEERKIQFLIVTHSPQFITTNSIKNTFRVYKENETSRVFIPKTEGMEKSDIKGIFQIVNVLNNEKIFFADKVILVEGVVDKIIYERILKILQKTEDNSEVIEIVEVYGKENFEKFREFLKTWRIKNYIFADLDFLTAIAPPEIKDLFPADCSKIVKSLNDKTSKDAKTLLESLNRVINKKKEELTEGDFQDIKDLFNYIKSRHISLKDDIAAEEEKRIESYIENQYQKNTFILKNGEIEDYFNEGHFDIERAIDMAQSITQDSISEEIKNNFTRVFNH